MMDRVTLKALCAALEELAPLHGAAPWDNVGLLLEPRVDAEVSRVLLCIDLSEPVVDEALELGASLVVAYHPPIFSGVKRLTQSRPLDRSIMRLIGAQVALYSPHTALDAVPGGVCDWLAEGLGSLSGSRPIEPSQPDSEAGMGRLVSLQEPSTVNALLVRLKVHLGLSHLRCALPDGADPSTMQVQDVALCPGAGGDLFEKVAGADLFLSGEMRHHDILARVAEGAAVILCDHSNSERGYLKRLSQALSQIFGDALHVEVSGADVEPLQVL